MKTWDAIIVGAGVTGLSLALELRRHGARILVVERGEPGREASHAAAGMLAHADPELPRALRDLAVASARLYPEFVHQLQDESGLQVDLRDEGTLLLCDDSELPAGCARLAAEDIRAMEPCLAWASSGVLLPERSLDPRALVSALAQAAKHRDIDIASGSTVTGILVEEQVAVGVRTDRTEFHAAAVVNCAGAWAGQLGLGNVPSRPVKGQMLSLIAPRREMLRHVVRAPDAYLVPRSDGRIIIGSTLEEAGFDKRVDADTVQRLHQAAANVVPQLGESRMHEVWAGLRPGTPDDLPILGGTAVDGYFLATGHFRNGILLAPVTALLMAQVVRGVQPEFDLAAFSPHRFAAYSRLD